MLVLLCMKKLERVFSAYKEARGSAKGSSGTTGLDVSLGLPL